MPRAQDVLRRLTEHFLKRLPSWPYVVAAIAIAGISHYFGEMEIVRPLREASAALLADLKVISPLNVMGAYYFQLTGCGVSFADGSITASCNAAGDVWKTMELYGLTGIARLAWPFVVLLQTVLTVWDVSGWMGRVIYLATLPVGIYGAAEAVYAMGDTRPGPNGTRIYDEWTILGWAIFAALIPAIAGLTALALQWLLILIVWIFGMALAFIVWLAAVLAAPFAYVSAAMGIVKEAKELEEGHATLKGKGHPPA